MQITELCIYHFSQLILTLNVSPIWSDDQYWMHPHQNWRKMPLEKNYLAYAFTRSLFYNCDVLDKNLMILCELWHAHNTITMTSHQIFRCSALITESAANPTRWDLGCHNRSKVALPKPLFWKPCQHVLWLWWMR